MLVVLEEGKRKKNQEFKNLKTDLKIHMESTRIIRKIQKNNKKKVIRNISLQILKLIKL